MEAGQHAEDRRIVDAASERDTTAQGPVRSAKKRSHLQDHQTSPEDCIPEDSTGDYTTTDPRQGFPGRVEGRRYALE